jgi:hypothetical protein
VAARCTDDSGRKPDGPKYVSWAQTSDKVVCECIDGTRDLEGSAESAKSNGYASEQMACVGWLAEKNKTKIKENHQREE